MNAADPKSENELFCYPSNINAHSNASSSRNSSSSALSEQHQSLESSNNSSQHTGLSINNAPCTCGCVPNIPSLFEMAEKRRLFRLQQAQKSSKSDENSLEKEIMS